MSIMSIVVVCFVLFFVQVTGQELTTVSISPGQEPTTVSINLRQEPTTVFINPDQEPTTVFIKPDKEPTTVFINPDQEPTNVSINPDQNPTNASISPVEDVSSSGRESESYDDYLFKETENDTIEYNDIGADGNDGSSGPVAVSDIINKILKGPEKGKLPSNFTHEELYSYISHLFDDEMSGVIRDLLPSLIDFMLHVDISPSCSSTLLTLAGGFRDKKTWAAQFLDSWGKIPSGLLKGSLSEFGNYDECLAIEVENDFDVDAKNMFGKFCLIEVNPPLPSPGKDRITFRKKILNYSNTDLENTLYDDWSKFVHEWYTYPMSLGLCIPSTCSALDLHNIVNHVINQFNFTATIGSGCDSNDEVPELSRSVIVSLVIIGTLIAIVILSTIFDMQIKKKINMAGLESSRFSIILMLLESFSIRKNTRQLFTKDLKGTTTETDIKSSNKLNYDPSSLSFIHGIRVITVFWLIIANIYLFGGYPLVNLAKNVESSVRSNGGDLLFQFILNSWTLIAEIFFFLSGFNLTIFTIYHLENNGKLNFFKYVINRWIRFTPSIAGAIFLAFIILSPMSGSGPIFKKYATAVTSTCETSWWTNIIFINNWYPVNNMCLRHTWFLSASFQLHIIAYFVIMQLHRNPVIGSIMASFFILIGIAVPGVMVYAYNLPPTYLLNEPYVRQLESDLSYLYFPTYNHFSCYFMGILLGYVVLYKEKESKSKEISKLWQISSWFLFPILSISSVLITASWNGLHETPSMTSSVVYSSLHRIIWISGIAWLIHEVANRRAGLLPSLKTSPLTCCVFQEFFKRMLSLRIFLPLSRLSYQMYLTHLLVIWYYYFTRKDLIQYKNFELLQTGAGIGIFTIFLSYITYILFEAPFTRIIKLLLYPPDDDDLEPSETPASSKDAYKRINSGGDAIKHDMKPDLTCGSKVQLSSFKIKPENGTASSSGPLTPNVCTEKSKQESRPDVSNHGSFEGNGTHTSIEIKDNEECYILSNTSTTMMSEVKENNDDSVVVRL